MALELAPVDSVLHGPPGTRHARVRRDKCAYAAKYMGRASELGDAPSRLPTGLLASAAGLGPDAAMLVFAGMLFALFGAQAAGQFASLEHAADERLV